MRIIPAIDLIDGKCVRLTQGNYAQKKVYNTNPLEVAQMFEAEGIQHLHLVDLDGAKLGKITNWKVLETLARHTSLQIDFGGGLYSEQDVRIAFESGATQITIGSIAVKNPETCAEWIQKYGNEKIILGADVRENLIAISGWENQTNIQIIDFLKDYTQKGIIYVICTDINKDGLLQGVSLALYKTILQEFPTLKLIASGGVSNLSDIESLKTLGVEGVIIGKAIYEKKIKLKELASFLM